MDRVPLADEREEIRVQVLHVQAPAPVAERILLDHVLCRRLHGVLEHERAPVSRKPVEPPHQVRQDPVNYRRQAPHIGLREKFANSRATAPV